MALLLQITASIVVLLLCFDTMIDIREQGIECRGFSKCFCILGRGYTFSTWLRIEKLVFDPSMAGQSLFCFLHGSGTAARGVAAALQGLFLTRDGRMQKDQQPFSAITVWKH